MCSTRSGVNDELVSLGTHSRSDDLSTVGDEHFTTINV